MFNPIRKTKKTKKKQKNKTKQTNKLENNSVKIYFQLHLQCLQNRTLSY